jgi:hypothetical protein
VYNIIIMRLGNKKFTLSSRVGVKRIGAGSRLAYKHSEKIEDVSDKVASGAGALAGGLTTAAGVIGSTGVGAPVAAGLLTAAGLAGSTAAAAKGVNLYSGYVNKGKRAAAQFDALF